MKSLLTDPEHQANAYAYNLMVKLMKSGDDNARLTRLKALYPDQYHLAQGASNGVSKKNANEKTQIKKTVPKNGWQK